MRCLPSTHSEPNQYLAFGLSGSSERPEMIGADVAVTFYDTLTSTVQVVDYTLKHKSQVSIRLFLPKSASQQESWRNPSPYCSTQTKHPH